MPAPRMAHTLARVSWLPSRVTRRRAKCVIVQNRNRMQNALAMEFMPFTAMPTKSGLPAAKSVARRASIMNSGAPGGCPTSSL